MTFSTHRTAAALLLAGAVLLPASTAQAKPHGTAPLLPVKAYASLPAFHGVKLSPDGKQIGFITNLKGRAALVMENLDGSQPAALSSAQDANIVNFYWATDKRLLVVYGFSETRGRSHIKLDQTRLMAVDRDGQNQAWIVKGKKISRLGINMAPQTPPTPQFQHKIIDLLPDDPEHILLSIDADLNGTDEVWKLNIFNGHYREVIQGMRGIQNWYADQNHTVRFGEGYELDNQYAILRDKEGHTAPLTKADWYKDADIIGFSKDPNIIYVTKLNQYGTLGVYKLALDSGKIIDTVYENPKVDVSYVKNNPETGWPAGVVFVTDRWHTAYFDQGLAHIQKVIDKSLPKTTNSIVGKAKGKEIYVIFAYSDVDPGVYYLLDLEAKKMSLLSPYMDGIDPKTQAHVKQVDIPVRDGSTIPAYITTPRGMESAKGLKAVVLPHGGPSARDTNDWDYWAQFLANRGYLVLQPNFRGSSGYGKKFEKAGEHQWGGLMQNDVTDATKWLIKEGYADKNHICIVGGSYGGYAALMGAVMEPGLYKCAASINGVTDIDDMKTHDKHFIGGLKWIKYMGLEGKSDSDVSPINHVQDIKVPVLLISAKDDARVPFKQSKDMDSKLRHAHKKSRLVLLENGNHTLDTEEARETMLTELEKFLKKNL
ncbi:S9 family peptidase [Kordiimonas marina]|uniref:S9 family peptidase n=1 Tax=Kordiimonas marina TaxID=2872312 RepID=UPI001FF556DD|nr:S9 family peptidase [Kordiimonas marina]MCJ9430812.1 S9 family peptidase [Kordiimonas marina]